MGQQIIKQPDGKYALFSSVVDGFVALNCTREDILDIWIEDYLKTTREYITRTCDALDRVERGESGSKPYYQFTMTWDEALFEHEKRFGTISLK